MRHCRPPGRMAATDPTIRRLPRGAIETICAGKRPEGGARTRQEQRVQRDSASTHSARVGFSWGRRDETQYPQRVPARHRASVLAQLQRATMSRVQAVKPSNVPKTKPRAAASRSLPASAIMPASSNPERRSVFCENTGIPPRLRPDVYHTTAPVPPSRANLRQQPLTRG